MRPRFLMALATIAAITASAAIAADPPGRDCSKVPNYNEMIDCVGRDSKAANAKVTQAYELLMKRLGTTTQAQMLARSQKAWLDYQSTYCAFMTSANEGGSIAGFTGPSCYATIAKARLLELEYQVNCQEGWFGCFR